MSFSERLDAAQIRAALARADDAGAADVRAALASGVATLDAAADLHLGNLYTEKDGTPGFFDTMTARGPGMLEVSYHVSASLDVADRPRWEAALVQHYLDELARNGIEPPAFDEAMRQYSIFLLYGHFVWISTESHYQTEAVNTANAARVSAAMLDNDTIGWIAAL